MQIVSSLDSTFGIEKLIGAELGRAKDNVAICVPWLENGFVSLLKNALSPSVKLSLLVKTPQENDKTFSAIRTLERETALKTDIVCVPWLHAKFVIIDHRDVIFGSANATSNGFYYNNEVLVVIDDEPEIADRFMQIFNQIRAQPSNLSWSIVKKYSGCPPYLAPELRIVRLVNRFFQQNDNSEAHVSSLAGFIQEHGHSFELAKMTIKEMLRNGLLYEPRNYYVKLVHDVT